jgi:phosphoribosylformylglycinamidine cyclo-ligase
MSGAYAHSGVDTSAADRGVAALVAVLRTIETGRASRSVLASGHYAAVLEVAPNLGIAVGTDGVGSKLIVAEQTGRYDTCASAPSRSRCSTTSPSSRPIRT